MSGLRYKVDALDPPCGARLKSDRGRSGAAFSCNNNHIRDGGHMKFKALVLALGIAATCAISAHAATLRFAFQGEFKSLDPYSLNESFTLGMLGNVYEGLTKRDKDLKIIPGLAERWEQVEPTRWRFYLRKGVKFQNGEDFTADDV